jgi:transposase-like protein
MLDAIMGFTNGMSACELRRMVEILKVMIVRELRGPDEEPTSCPHCGSEHIVKKGLQKNEDGKGNPKVTQRFLCKDCDRTFNKRTNGVLAQSKLKAWQWVRFVELMLRKASLAKCELECHVSAPTAHYMRLRICQVMAKAVPAFACREGERVEVDGTYVNESLCGLGRRGGAMPRVSHRSGNDVREHGISNLKVCVVCGVSDSGDVFLELCDRGRPSDKALAESLRGKVNGAVVVTDAHQGYGRVLPGLGVASHEAYEKGGSELGRVNALHQRYKDFLRPFNGVSTRYIDMYTCWFRYTEYLRNSKGDDLESMFGLAASGRYFLTRSALNGRERPFWDYWEGKLPEIDAESIWGPDAA